MLGEGTPVRRGEECSSFVPWVEFAAVVFVISVEETRIASNLNMHAFILEQR